MTLFQNILIAIAITIAFLVIWAIYEPTEAKAAIKELSCFFWRNAWKILSKNIDKDSFRV